MGVDLIRLKQLHRKRETRANMATVFRCSKSTVDRALRRAGLYNPDCDKVHPPTKRAVVLQAYKDKVPLKRIQIEYGVPASTVCLWAHKAGVPLRRKGGKHVKR